MKRRLPTLLESTALSIACTWGAMGCLISGFALPLGWPNRIMLVWLGFSLLCALAMPFRFGQTWVLLLGAVGALWLWLEESFGGQLLSLLSMISKIYEGAYGWGIPEALKAEGRNVDLPVTVLGMLLIFVVSRAVSRRKDNSFAVLVTLLPLFACLPVTDIVPELPYLFALLLGVSLLLLSDSVRRESAPQAARLTAFAAVPVAAALGLLLYFCPREGYVNTTEALREKLVASLLELPQKLQLEGLDWLSGLEKRESVELTSLPSQLLLSIPVAEVNAEQSGPVYLRGRDYDVYTGKRWESSTGRQEALVGAGGERGRVTVRILNSQGSALLPAFPEGQSFLTDGVSEEQREVSAALRLTAMASLPGEQWLKLPESSSQQIKALLQAIPGRKGTLDETVLTVADYVKSCAVYDRSGTQLPSEESDFALWFLQRADRGYCVHFATAAAVLLRSAGIPTRYVTGYRVDAQAGQTVAVTSDDAHAWVEYYDYRTWSWNILEATPGEDSLPPEEVTETTTQTMPTEQSTQPAQTLPAQTAPPQTLPTEQGIEEKSWHLPVWIPLTAATLVLAYCLAELERLLRISLRRRSQIRGSTNRRAVACHQELRLLARLLKRPLPEELEELTEKALYSQHTLTPEELSQFTACQSACRRLLRKAPWWRRLLYRYWFAVI